MNFLSGSKTFIVGGVMVVVGILQLIGINIEAFGDYSGGQLIMEGLGFVGLRLGMSS